MEKVINPVQALTPTKSGLVNVWRIVLWLLVFGLVACIIYYFAYLRNLSWATIKRLIAEESAKQPDKEKASTEHILLQGVKEILFSPHLNAQARDFAKAHNLPFERVVVDNAIAMAKNLHYIPA